MKRTFALLFVCLVVTTRLYAEEPLLFAQEATPENPPAPAPLDLMPEQPPTPSTNEMPLIPDTPPSTRKSSGAAVSEPKAPKKSATQEAEDAIQQRIKMRAAKTKALNDPAVHAEWERSQIARTDYEKREALKSYYTKLYARMVKIDSSLKPLIDKARDKSLAQLQQNRVSPTVPR